MSETIKVIGPPGTGKTEFGMSVVDEALRRGMHPAQIVYSTFTRAAAREACTRAMQRFPQYGPDDFPYFRTCHSICKQLIGVPSKSLFADKWRHKFGEACGYEFGSQFDNPKYPEQNQTMLSTDDDYFEFFWHWSHNMLLRPESDEAYSRFCSKVDTPYRFEQGRVMDFIRRRMLFKHENNLVDFPELLEMVIDGGKHPCPELIIWDETQDNSPLMNRVMRMWMSGTEKVYLIGDPDQAIYGFMGADPRLFLDLKSDDQIPLTVGHRLPVKHLPLAEGVIGRNTTRYPHPGITPTLKKGWVWVADELDGRWWDNLPPGRIFLANRARVFMTQQYEQLLRMQIPFVTSRGRLSPLELKVRQAVETWARLNRGESVTLQELSRATAEFIFGKQLQHGTKVKLRAAAGEHPDWTVRLGDLPSWGFRDTDLFNENFLYSLRMESVYRSYFRGVLKKYGLEMLDPGCASVLLSTIHGLKGQECDISIVNLEITKKVEEDYKQDPEPENRVFYVALTRARDGIVLLDPPRKPDRRMFPWKPPGNQLSIPDQEDAEEL